MDRLLSGEIKCCIDNLGLSESEVACMQLEMKTLTTTGGGGGGREGGGSLITCKTGLIKNCRLHR